jgi:hypothetical protein
MDMKYLFFISISLFSISVFGQHYPFAKEFVDGTIILKDSTIKKGQIKWFPHQNEKLRFRTNENSELVKYSPDELQGFYTDSLQFKSLFNLEMIGGSYPLLEKPTKVKHIFGEVLDTGKFNIYFITFSDVDLLSSSPAMYMNFLFEKKNDSISNYSAFPFIMRMKDKKYEKIKENLLAFFTDYPQALEKIKIYKKEDDFFEVVNFLKQLN